MNRDQCIEAIERKIRDARKDAIYYEWDRPEEGPPMIIDVRALATAAYDAMADHIQAERERVWGMCEGAVARRSAVHAREAKAVGRNTTSYERRTYAVSVLLEAKSDIRALDIGDKTDG